VSGLPAQCVGLIEPLSILHPDAKKSEYLLLDGHLRVPGPARAI